MAGKETFYESYGDLSEVVFNYLLTHSFIKNTSGNRCILSVLIVKNDLYGVIFSSINYCLS